MGGGREKKKPKAVREPDPQKIPRVRAEPTSRWGERPSWRIRRLDVGGPFCVSRLERGDLLANNPPSSLGRVLRFLGDLETMTWGQILGPNHHYIPVESLNKDARDRLVALRRDDVDQVVSLRVTGGQRVFGVTHGSVCELLWWDPEHRVAPYKGADN